MNTSISPKDDILSIDGIQKYLKSICSNIKLSVFQTVTSTNTILRERAVAGATEGCAIVASNQTCGKGRRGRDFFSPADTGIYMSLLLRPQESLLQQATRITTIAAVAVCEAIEAVSSREATIKWVNDVYIDGKKVSGILTEASVNMENRTVDYIVLGIGMNVYHPEDGFPKAIEDVAGVVLNEPQSDSKNRLVAEILNHFMGYYSAPLQTSYTDEYRKRSFLIGEEINVLFHNHQKSARALEVDDDCRLVVEYEDGKIEKLTSGEVSVRYKSSSRKLSTSTLD